MIESVVSLLMYIQSGNWWHVFSLVVGDGSVLLLIDCVMALIFHIPADSKYEHWQPGLGSNTLNSI